MIHSVGIKAAISWSKRIFFSTRKVSAFKKLYRLYLNSKIWQGQNTNCKLIIEYLRNIFKRNKKGRICNLRKSIFLTSSVKCWLLPLCLAIIFESGCNHRHKDCHQVHWPEQQVPATLYQGLCHHNHPLEVSAETHCQECWPISWASLSDKCWCHHLCAVFLK